MIENLQYVSIAVEALIAVMGVMLVRKKRVYGWGISLTFGIYVFYDLVRLAGIAVSEFVLYPMFLVATLSAFWAVWKMLKSKK